VPAVLAACSTPRSPLPPIPQIVEQLQYHFTGDKLTDCLKKPLSGQRDCRDEIVQALMAAIDVRYAEYEREFFDGNRLVGFGSSVAVLGLGTAGSLAATGTAQVLNAISAAVTGTREAFGREMMADQTSAALLTAMRNARNQVAIRIREGLRQDGAGYPLGIALFDIHAYFRAGTMPGALSSLTEIVGDRARTTQQELRTVGRGFATTPSAARLRNHLEAPELTEAQRDLRMREVMDAARAESLGDITIVSWINDQSAPAEEQRIRVARRLRLLP
jgi:hypothetical protein